MKVMVRSLVRWSWLLVLCLLIGWFGGKTVAKLVPPTYQATTIIQLDTQSHGGGIIKPVTAYASLLTSDSVLGSVLKNYPNIDRLAFITKQLVVTSAVTSQTIEIQVTLSDAKEAAKIANDLANALVTQQNANIQTELAQEIKIIQGRITGEQNTINHLNQEIIQTPASNTATIQLYQSQITQQQSLQTRDITSLQTLQSEQQLQGAPLSIVQKATTPTKPSSLIGLVPIAQVFLLLMLILGVVCIVVIEQRMGRITSVNVLHQKINLPVLGSLRWIRPSPLSVPLNTLIASKSLYSEDCRIMMVDTLFHAEEAKAHILAVIGTRPGSGSSSVASQLATLLAESKRRVLLIDANLYHPTQHIRFGVPNDAGLAKALDEVRAMKAQFNLIPKSPPPAMKAQFNLIPKSPPPVEISQRNAPVVPVRSVAGAVSPAKVPTPDTNHKFVEIEAETSFNSHYIISSQIENLFVLPAGKSNANPSSLLSMPEMGQYLRWASRPVDFVVIDCPSLVHAEAHVLGSLSDQAYLVVDATKNRIQQVLSTEEDLVSTGVKLSGLILNKLGRWI